MKRREFLKITGSISLLAGVSAAGIVLGSEKVILDKTFMPIYLVACDQVQFTWTVPDVGVFVGTVVHNRAESVRITRSRLLRSNGQLIVTMESETAEVGRAYTEVKV